MSEGLLLKPGGSAASVPPAPRERPESDYSKQDDDHPDNEAPSNRDHDPDR